MEWLNYHHLLYFWAVAKNGSVSRACEELRLAQPTISGQIRALEGVLGEKLFARSGRHLVMTEMGRVVFRYAEDIFSLGRDLISTVKGHGSGRPLRLVVGIALGEIADAHVGPDLLGHLDHDLGVVLEEGPGVLLALPELVAARPSADGGWEIHVVRHGRLAGATVVPRGVDPRPSVDALASTRHSSGVFEPGDDDPAARDHWRSAVQRSKGWVS